MVTHRALAAAPWGCRRRIAGRRAAAHRQGQGAGARRRARIACEELGIEPQLEPKLAGGPFDPEALAAGLGDDVLLVGHDPDFSMAVHSLTGAQVRMKKGGLAGIEKGELRVLLRATETRALAD